MWLRKARPAESICHECFMGQADHDRVDEPTDFGELWYGDEALEEKRRRFRETAREIRSPFGHVEVHF